MSRKEGKEKKKLDTLNLVSGAQSPEERECRRESEPLVPTDAFATGLRVFVPSDDSKYNTQKTICQGFCQKNFLYIYLGSRT